MQKTTSRAMIWSPESIVYKPDVFKDWSEAKRLWGRRLSFNIEQFDVGKMKIMLWHCVTEG
jgi:hypothetical protein